MISCLAPLHSTTFHSSIMKKYSCIDIYAHSCLKPFSIGRKPCSNSKTHVQIRKFTCRLKMGFGRHHWSMQRDVMCFVETKWPTLKKLRGFRTVFTLLTLFSRDFKWIRVEMQPWFVSASKHLLDLLEGV